MRETCGKILIDILISKENMINQRILGEKDQPFKHPFALRCHVPCIININVLESTTTGWWDQKNSYMQLRSARHVVFLNNMLDTWMQDEKCAPPMGYGLWHWACQNVFNLQIMTNQLNINQTTSGIQHQFKGFRDSGRVNPERDYS